MNTERLMAKGLLSELKREARQLDIEISGLLISIRNILNVYEDDVIKLEIEKALTQMRRLKECQDLLKEKRAKIKRIEEDLR